MEEFYFYLTFIALILSLMALWVVAFRVRRGFLILSITFLLLGLPPLINYLITSYSTSVPEVIVPNVCGLSREAAVARLEASSLKANLGESVFNQVIPEGEIAIQRPEAGRTVKAGRIVNLIISRGPPPMPESNPATPEPEAH